jgi:hypothetical protein
MIILNEIATPSTPAAGHTKLYAKTDGGIYKMSNNGVETSLLATIPGTWPESPDFISTGLTASKFPTWINQGAATIADVSGDGIVLRQAQDSLNQIRTRYKSLINTNYYKITFQVLPTTWGQYSRVGITLMYSGQADPTRAVFFGYMQRDDSPFIAIQKYTAHTTYDGVYYEYQMRPPVLGPMWFQLEDDGTNWNWRISTDGTNWVALGTTTRNDWFSGAADRVGLSIVGECAVGLDVIGWFRSWKEEHYVGGVWHTETL